MQSDTSLLGHVDNIPEISFGIALVNVMNWTAGLKR
jgi:hypothetical protein